MEESTKPKRFHANHFRSIGTRKDRARNASKVLNLAVYKGYSITQITKKTGLSDRTIRNILTNPVIRSEIEKINESVKLDALNTVRRALDSRDAKVAVYAAKTVHAMLSTPDAPISAPSVNVATLVSTVANSLLASTMLGIQLGSKVLEIRGEPIENREKPIEENNQTILPTVEKLLD